MGSIEPIAEGRAVHEIEGHFGKELRDEGREAGGEFSVPELIAFERGGSHGQLTLGLGLKRADRRAANCGDE
jgi:hypothetical protein